MRAGIALLVWMAACAHAKYRCPDRGGPAWIEARSAHFVVQTNLPSEAAISKIGALERLRAGMALLWRTPPEPGAPLDLFLPRNAEESAEFGESPVRIRITRFGELVLVASGEADVVSDPLIKTLMAGTLDGIWRVERVPWLAVGFELYLEGARIDGSDALLGEPSLLALRALREHRGPSPVGWIVDANRPGQIPDPGTSWLLVHYLIDARRAQFVDLLRRLGRGEEEKDALAASFGQFDAGALDDALERYWKEGRIGTARLALPPIDERVQTRALTEAELHGFRADLLMSPDRDDEREEALRHDPTEPRAIAAMSDAERALEAARASALSHPRDWRPWYLLWRYASGLKGDDLDDFLVRKSAPRSAEAEAAISRAASLTANAPMPHLILADLALARSDAALALGEAEIAVRVAPRRALYLDTYAAALAGSGRCSAARAVQQRAVERVESEAALTIRRAIREHFDDYQQRCPGK
jgi:hypothetical protein